MLWPTPAKPQRLRPNRTVFDYSDRLLETAVAPSRSYGLEPSGRHIRTPLIAEVQEWGLRVLSLDNDAAYIALAEATGGMLYTCDAKLSKGHRARAMVFAD
jgi:hypothetical protein